MRAIDSQIIGLIKKFTLHPLSESFRHHARVWRVCSAFVCVQRMELEESKPGSSALVAKQQQKSCERRKDSQRATVKRMEVDVGDVTRQARCDKAQAKRANRRGEATETLRQKKKQVQQPANLRKPKDEIKDCKFGVKCTQALCPFNHPRRRFIDIDCRDGVHCQRLNCRFKHPSPKQQKVKCKPKPRARAKGRKQLSHQAPKQQVQQAESSDSGTMVAFDALGATNEFLDRFKVSDKKDESRRL